MQDFKSYLIINEEIKIDENSSFSEQIWKDNRHWIERRLISNQKDVKSINKKIKRSDNKTKSTPGVYGKLIKAKTIGSIIYTRMSK